MKKCQSLNSLNPLNARNLSSCPTCGSIMRPTQVISEFVTTTEGCGIRTTANKDGSRLRMLEPEDNPDQQPQIVINFKCPTGHKYKLHIASSSIELTEISTRH